ncbi:protein of unknown function [Pseudodesulfovibrio piezophilus C1TLV30]|uniref:Uncharacterized protein n=1 Tax=Pseudodesulfovibrio piezophilus (strain DSM 21447 / JCM 15486 / C1TLV30) TaxID=1322246 RepID=M1WJL9_PSEP2|nr:protein of unknown function [Pseudodesulfovibrio piezophilus C1TLV30]
MLKFSGIGIQAYMHQMELLANDLN